jgi:hypothetical protein
LASIAQHYHLGNRLPEGMLAWLSNTFMNHGYGSLHCDGFDCWRLQLPVSLKRGIHHFDAADIDLPSFIPPYSMKTRHNAI